MTCGALAASVDEPKPRWRIAAVATNAPWNGIPCVRPLFAWGGFAYPGRNLRVSWNFAACTQDYPLPRP